MGGIATIVLAIIGLSGVKPDVLVSIATIVFGAALLIQGGAMLSEFAQTEVTPDANAASGGGGLSALFLVGVGGIVLGVLALLGIHATMLTGGRRDRLRQRVGDQQLRGLAAPDLALGGRCGSRPAPPWCRFIASEVAAGSAGVQAMAGLAVIVLGILAVCGVFTGPLTLIALLVAGAAILLTGSTLSGTMMGFMRDNGATPSPARAS